MTFLWRSLSLPKGHLTIQKSSHSQNCQVDVSFQENPKLPPPMPPPSSEIRPYSGMMIYKGLPRYMYFHHTCTYVFSLSLQPPARCQIDFKRTRFISLNHWMIDPPRLGPNQCLPCCVVMIFLHQRGLESFLGCLGVSEFCFCRGRLNLFRSFYFKKCSHVDIYRLKYQTPCWQNEPLLKDQSSIAITSWIWGWQATRVQFFIDLWNWNITSYHKFSSSYKDMKFDYIF